MPLTPPTTHVLDEFWELDGVPLNTYGWNVTTFGGSRYDLPALRGENIKIAYRPGSIPRPRVADQRVINLVMWCSAMDPQTGAAPSNPYLGFNRNWDFLRSLVWKPSGGTVTLTRRWWQADASGNPVLMVADATAQIADTMSPTMTGRFRADFTLSLVLTDPFFYGRANPAVPHSRFEITLPADGTVVINNPGQDLAAYGDLEIQIYGAFNSPMITNVSTGVWVQYNGGVEADRSRMIDVANFRCYKPESGEVFDHKIAHAGARHWMGLLPGNNTIELVQGVASADGGVTGPTGYGVLRYRPPYV